MKVSQSQNLNNCYVCLQRSPILYLTADFTNKVMVQHGILGPFLGNAFLSYHEKNWLNSCPQGFKLVFCRRYVCSLQIEWKYFQEFLNSCHINISFSMETERQNKLSFLDFEVIREQDKFKTTIYRY